MMDLLNAKINLIYKLVRFIGNEQQKAAKTLKKLVALDELSEGFWNVSYLDILRNLFYIFEIIIYYFGQNAYKEVSKQLLPTILFPTAREY